MANFPCVGTVKKVSVWLPEELWRKARIRALEEGRAVSELVQQALEAHLGKQERPRKPKE